MKPRVLYALTEDQVGEIRHKNLVAYSDTTHQVFIDAELNKEDLKILIDNNDGIISHISDPSLHWSASDRRDYKTQIKILTDHVADKVIHVTQDDRNRWDSKETEAGAQEKANAVRTLLGIHETNNDIHITPIEKFRWNNTYTREETNNMVQRAQSNSVWKEAVDTYDELFTEYPNAKEGWICTVLDDPDRGIKNVTYSFDGTTWVVAFINTMPLATTEQDGRMSKEYVIKLETIEPNANYYIHPDTINMRHVTDAQIKMWSNKASKDLATIFEPGLMSADDKDKSDTVERYANYYVHPDTHDAAMIITDDMHMFVTKTQIDAWSNPAGQLADELHDGAMTKEMYIKVTHIEDYANYYVHPLKHSSTDIAEDQNHRFVTDRQIADWTSKETELQSQHRADTALRDAKEYTDKAIDKLLGTSGDALDTLQELANALGNDPNFATTMTIELSNKVDKTVYSVHSSDYSMHLSSSDRLLFNTLEAYANHYIHPDTHPATMIVEDLSHRFVSDAQIAIWNNKANGDLATPLRNGQMSKEYAAKLESITTTGKIKADWNEQDEDSGSYIMNKPTSMPANGGTAEKVEGYNSKDLINSRKAATLVIGTASAGFTDKDVDVLCDGVDDSVGIKIALSKLPSSGGSIILREGNYKINQTISTTLLNLVIKGSGNVIFDSGLSGEDPMFDFDTEDSTIEGITFDCTTTPATSRLYAIKFTGSHNIVTKCKFIKGYGITMSSGSYNKISDCSFEQTFVGVYLKSETESSFGNIVYNNSFYTNNPPEDLTYGIVIESSINKTNGNNVINGNVIYNFYTGIKLTNEYMTHNTVNNCITGNTIMRGTGLTTDYLYEQRPIFIEYGSYNVVNGNMLRGRDVMDRGTNNICTNNITA